MGETKRNGGDGQGKEDDDKKISPEMRFKRGAELAAPHISFDSQPQGGDTAASSVAAAAPSARNVTGNSTTGAIGSMVDPATTVNVADQTRTKSKASGRSKVKTEKKRLEVSLCWSAEGKRQPKKKDIVDLGFDPESQKKKRKAGKKAGGKKKQKSASFLSPSLANGGPNSLRCHVQCTGRMCQVQATKSHSPALQSSKGGSNTPCLAHGRFASPPSQPSQGQELPTPNESNAQIQEPQEEPWPEDLLLEGDDPAAIDAVLEAGMGLDLESFPFNNSNHDGNEEGNEDGNNDDGLAGFEGSIGSFEPSSDDDSDV